MSLKTFRKSIQCIDNCKTENQSYNDGAVTFIQNQGVINAFLFLGEIAAVYKGLFPRSFENNRSNQFVAFFTQLLSRKDQA